MKKIATILAFTVGLGFGSSACSKGDDPSAPSGDTAVSPYCWDNPGPICLSYPDGTKQCWPRDNPTPFPEC